MRAPVKWEMGGKTQESYGQRSKSTFFPPSCFYKSREKDGLFRES